VQITVFVWETDDLILPGDKGDDEKSGLRIVKEALVCSVVRTFIPLYVLEVRKRLSRKRNASSCLRYAINSESHNSCDMKMRLVTEYLLILRLANC
jgi:hypothetical protein